MAQTRMFVDTGVLIMAFRGAEPVATAALQVLTDVHADLVTSDFVQLELLPKAIYHGRSAEQRFYERFLGTFRECVPTSTALVQEARKEAEQAGLSAMDALHIAAAKSSGCTEFITSELPTKPLFRVNGLTIRSIQP